MNISTTDKGFPSKFGSPKVDNMDTTTTEGEPLLSVAQVAAELNITGRAVRHRILAGTMTATKVGGGATSAYVISRDELDRIKAAA